MTATTQSTCAWRFRPVPADGGETGGDPAFTSFRRSLDVFVREVVQNSLDARCDDRPVSVRFVMDQIAGERKADFLRRRSPFRRSSAGTYANAR